MLLRSFNRLIGSNSLTITVIHDHWKLCEFAAVEAAVEVSPE